jgi:NAD(P)H-dependent flavin oxidoreductase YrpB (nitropropane dioxygenase family)
MKLFTEVFNCRYPIVAMAMNQVSDLPLASAVRRAGALPSLSVFNYLNVVGDQIVLIHENLEKDLAGYHNEFNDCELLLSLNLSSLTDPLILEMILKYRVKLIEIIKDDTVLPDDVVERLPKIIWSIKDNGSLIFRKIVDKVAHLEPGVWSKNLDGFIVKGPDGAGRGSVEGLTLEESCNILRTKFPDKLLIPSGGIGTSQQVKEYMSQGAFAIGIGTLLAASKESKISEATKLKMIGATSADLSKLSTGTYTETKQNALVFSSDVKERNMNNTRGLIVGIKDPSRGHVFAGKSIDQIKEILPANDIIQGLVKDL